MQLADPRLTTARIWAVVLAALVAGAAVVVLVLTSDHQDAKAVWAFFGPVVGLRASRTRLVEAGDLARRRLERDLHDGAQSRLDALTLLLRTARMLRRLADRLAALDGTLSLESPAGRGTRLHAETPCAPPSA